MWQGHCRSRPSPRAAHHPPGSPKQGKAGGGRSQERGHSTAPRPLPDLDTYISHCPFSHPKRLLYNKLLCYCLDFVSSSLVYSLRQMPAFPCPALRYQSPTQQLTATPRSFSSKPKSKDGKPASHSIYQLMPSSSQSACAQTEKEASATLPGMRHVHAHLTSNQHCLDHKPGERTLKTTPWSTSRG